MARRLEIELTSTRPDGTWTWRAAGAKQPKGELDGSLIPEGVGVGDVVKVEAEAYVDGLTITLVLPPKGARKEPERIELLGSGRNDDLVTTQLAPKGRGRGNRGRAREDDRDRGRGRGPGRDARRSEHKGGNRPRGGDKGDGGRAEKPKPPARPKAPRLRPGRTHRQSALADLPDLQQPLADEVLKGGVPGVRQAVDRMNEKAAAEGMPKVKSEPLVALAERLAPSLKAAEWRDRADAALAGMEAVDLRDIRSVVVAADNAARDEETRALADKLREGLTHRVEGEHRRWLDELAQTIGEGRTVRALRLSSRPPKAGAPIPSDMAERLAAAASGSLTSEISQERWATVLDAVAYSPVRTQVVPESMPGEPGDQLLSAVRKLASRIPTIAASFGVDAPTKQARRGRRRPPPPPPKIETPDIRAAEAPETAPTAAPAGEAAEAAPTAAPAGEAPEAAPTAAPAGEAPEAPPAPEAAPTAAPKAAPTSAPETPEAMA